MAKILNSTFLSGNISKMVETPDQFIINGTTYDKNTFSPNAFDFYPYVVGTNNEMSLYQTAYVNSRWYKNRTTNGFLLDNNDSSVAEIIIQIYDKFRDKQYEYLDEFIQYLCQRLNIIKKEE